jgi:hypothetical protein
MSNAVFRKLLAVVLVHGVATFSTCSYVSAQPLYGNDTSTFREYLLSKYGIEYDRVASISRYSECQEYAAMILTGVGLDSLSRVPAESQCLSSPSEIGSLMLAAALIGDTSTLDVLCKNMRGKVPLVRIYKNEDQESSVLGMLLKAGDTVSASIMLRHGHPVVGAMPDRSYLILWAVQATDAGPTRLLCRYNVDVNLISEETQYFKPIHIAVSHMNIDAFAFLLEIGAETEFVGSRTPSVESHIERRIEGYERLKEVSKVEVLKRTKALLQDHRKKGSGKATE